MSGGFTKICISRKAEQAFRRRAIKNYPLEYMETLWGRILGTEVHIHAFMDIKHKGRYTFLTYEEEDLDNQEDEAAEHRLELLGTIHSHPDHLETIFSEGDLREVQESQDTVMGICAITQEYVKGKLRRSTDIAYWPAPRPLKICYI